MAPLLKITPTQIIKHGEIELVPIQSLHPYSLVSLVQEATQHGTKGEHKEKLSTNPLINTGVLLAIFANAIVT